MAEVYECGNCFQWVTSAIHICWAGDPKTRRPKPEAGGTMSEKVLSKEFVAEQREPLTWMSPIDGTRGVGPERARALIAVCDSHEALRAERDAALAEVERLRVQLAGCAVAAQGGIKEPVPEYGNSASLQDVFRLRSEVERMRPVVEAAEAWCAGESCQCPGGKLDPHRTDCPWQRVEQRLFDVTMDRASAQKEARP